MFLPFLLIFPFTIPNSSTLLQSSPALGVVESLRLSSLRSFFSHHWLFSYTETRSRKRSKVFEHDFSPCHCCVTTNHSVDPSVAGRLPSDGPCPTVPFPETTTETTVLSTWPGNLGCFFVRVRVACSRPVQLQRFGCKWSLDDCAYKWHKQHVQRFKWGCLKPRWLYIQYTVRDRHLEPHLCLRGNNVTIKLVGDVPSMTSELHLLVEHTKPWDYPNIGILVVGWGEW